MTAFQLLATIESGEMEKAAADPLKLMQRVAKTYAPRILNGVKGNGRTFGEVIPQNIEAFRPYFGAQLGGVGNMRSEFRAMADLARSAEGTAKHSLERQALAKDIRSLRNTKWRSHSPVERSALEYVQPATRASRNAARGAGELAPVSSSAGPTNYGLAPARDTSRDAMLASRVNMPASVRGRIDEIAETAGPRSMRQANGRVVSSPALAASPAAVDPAAAQRTLAEYGMADAPRLGMRDRINQWYGGLSRPAQNAVAAAPTAAGIGTLGYLAGRQNSPSAPQQQAVNPNMQAYPTFYGGNVS